MYCRGWGIRSLDDIPAGRFICIYAGQLLTEQGANEVSVSPIAMHTACFMLGICVTREHLQIHDELNFQNRKISKKLFCQQDEILDYFISIIKMLIKVLM